MRNNECRPGVRLGEDSEYRRDELVRKIERAVEQMSLAELEAEKAQEKGIWAKLQKKSHSNSEIPHTGIQKK